MARIAITDGMADGAQKALKNMGHELVVETVTEEDLIAGYLRHFEVVIIRSNTKLSSEVISSSVARGGRLIVIAKAGVGVDNIDLEAANEHGIMVVNAPRASTQSVVELTIGHLLASTRHLPRADAGLRDGNWEKNILRGTELSGKAIGFIGFGRIAQGVGRLASAFGMELHAYDPYLPPKIARDMNCRLHARVDDVFRMCTHISVHCNLSDETYHLVDSERIDLMPGVSPQGIRCGNHIVNCARGGIVDEDAALSALGRGQLASVALDVFENEPVNPDSELLQHPNFHGTPHIGAATKEAQYRVGMDIGQAVDTALRTNTCETLVNRSVNVRTV
jgi:D-3-phosphoglycerate dehydrogenase